MPVKGPFLERLKLSGYKSIREAELEFTKLNVLFTRSSQTANGTLLEEVGVVRFISSADDPIKGILDAFFKGPSDIHRIRMMPGDRNAQSYPWPR